MTKYGKVELANFLVERGSFKTKKDATKAIEALAEGIREIVNAGDEVVLVNFATFKTVDRAEKGVRHPGTGEMMTIPARKVVKITASKKF